MRSEGMGLLLNRLSEGLPRYGSCVWKFENDDIRQVKIDNLIFDPAVNNVEKKFDIRSSYVIEKKFLNTFELEQMKDKGWDSEKIDEVLEDFRKQQEGGKVGGEIVIYEFHIELPNEYFESNAS